MILTPQMHCAYFELVKFSNIHAADEHSQRICRTAGRTRDPVRYLGHDRGKKAEMLDRIHRGTDRGASGTRKEKNFARADEIRDELVSPGHCTEDTREGVKWKRA